MIADVARRLVRGCYRNWIFGCQDATQPNSGMPTGPRVDRDKGPMPDNRLTSFARTTASPNDRPTDLGPKQKTWCDQYLLTVRNNENREGTWQ